MTRYSSLAIAALAGTSSVSAITYSNAEAAFHTLQQWYNETNGLWVPSTGWWNSANCLTAIADLAMIDPKVNFEATTIFPITWVEAQKYNLQMQKVFSNNFLMTTYYTETFPHFPPGWNKPPPLLMTGFLNDYYDDEGWWALAWIAAYDVTHNPEYLRTAEAIFDDMASVWGTTPCGGIWWNKGRTYVNAIANELFLDVAAHLANRAGYKAGYYLNWAKKQYAWFEASGMINAQNTINDGLDSKTCKNNNGTVWSYNQGVILGGLAEMTRATRDQRYVKRAQQIADAAIGALAPTGILHDPCEPNCGADGSQFKGVFARNLQILNKQSPQARYKEFLQKNADSIWATDRNGNNELSVIWSGPFVQTANASTQSSAMDAITGALGAART